MNISEIYPYAGIYNDNAFADDSLLTNDAMQAITDLQKDSAISQFLYFVGDSKSEHSDGSDSAFSL